MRSSLLNFPNTDTQAKVWLLLSTLICLGLFLVSIPLPRVDGHLVGSDGLSYYAILRSLLMDRDFDFSNDYALLGVVTTSTTVTGLPTNPFAIGTALLWSPFFLLAHLLSLFLNVLGAQVATNGVSYIYEAAVCIGTILYASGGFTLLYGVLRKRFSVESSLLAILALWWTSNALYYIVAEPSMSHALTIFSGALFLSLWYPPDPARGTDGWIRLGLAAGLVALVRWQEVFLAGLPLAELLWWGRQRQLSLSQVIGYGILFALALLLMFIPQFWMWSTLYGSPLTIPQGDAFIDWSSPQWISTLFSTRHGLISWHPIFLLALLGLPALWKYDRALTLGVALLFLLQLYLNSAVVRWWADDAFGGRRFIGLVPVLAMPLAALIEMAKAHRWQRLVGTLLVALLLWNGLSLLQYRLGFVSRVEALTLREMTLDRLLLPWYLLQAFLN